MPEDREVLWLQDRVAIHDLLVRYAVATDEWDTEAVVTCFSADATFARDGRVVARGAPELRAFFERGRTGGRYGQLGARTVDACNHIVGNVTVDLDGDRATARSWCNAFASVRQEGRHTIVATAIRYRDQLIRTGAGWKIAARVHILDWSFESPALPPP